MSKSDRLFYSGIYFVDASRDNIVVADILDNNIYAMVNGFVEL